MNLSPIVSSFSVCVGTHRQNKLINQIEWQINKITFRLMPCPDNLSNNDQLIVVSAELQMFWCYSWSVPDSYMSLYQQLRLQRWRGELTIPISFQFKTKIKMGEGFFFLGTDFSVKGGGEKLQFKEEPYRFNVQHQSH